MYKVLTIILLSCCGFTLMALQGKTSNNEIHHDSARLIYQGTLQCESPLTSGSFQHCSFELQKKNRIVKNTAIFISGGMEGHHHGLPTSPKAVWSEQEQSYQIKGLKFSMPGKWILNFNINAAEATEQDSVSMAITVN